MSLEIIGVGFGRTGTLSLRTALETLGHGPCHHMFCVRDSAEEMARWTAIATTGTADWPSVFASYRSQVDWPGVRYWRDIVRAFPAARVVLSYRDPVQWYESFSRTIVRANRAAIALGTEGATRALAELVERVVFRDTFDDRPEDRNFAISVYLRHMSEVLAEVDPARTLLYDIAQGWGPLCSFLGVPVPDLPFPHSNTRGEFLARKGFLADAGP